MSAQVYLYGAVVASWTQPSGDEVLYVRPDAKFDKSKPISGGIPHCFPQVLHHYAKHIHAHCLSNSNVFASILLTAVRKQCTYQQNIVRYDMPDIGSAAVWARGNAAAWLCQESGLGHQHEQRRPAA